MPDTRGPDSIEKNSRLSPLVRELMTQLHAALHEPFGLFLPSIASQTIRTQQDYEQQN